MKHSIIWNITRACPWHCDFCCVGALYVPREEQSQQKRLESQGIELSLDEKLRIVENLDNDWFKLDVSGGEPLLFADNRHIIERLSSKLGKENLSVTSTGKGLELVSPEWLQDNVSEVGFTYDFPREHSPNRPKGYNQSNLSAIKNLGGTVRTMAQTPLTRDNSDPEIISEIYQNLKDVNVDTLLLIGLKGSGRGHGKENLNLSRKERLRIVRIYKAQESHYNGPKIKLAPNLYGPLVEKFVGSFNIDTQGRLLSNPWSYNIDGTPYARAIMGDLKSEKLSILVGKLLPQAYLRQVKRNLEK